MGLRLNFRKTVVVPLWDEEVTQAQARMDADAELPNLV